MGLLHWCTVSPEGPSNLAAIRFTAHIRVSHIRIFPTGARPFAQCPEVVAQTEPEAFYLDVYFNAQSNSQEPKDKQRAPNALVPTTIAYAGGQVDFSVDLGTEYSTRLMIVKGQFESLSMAIYGDIVSEIPPPPTTYEEKPLPSLEPMPLSKAVDPANSSDPTVLAKQLLAMIPDSPSLSLVTRLMFCMKPPNEDWEDPSFPFLFADLDVDEEDIDLDRMLQKIARPLGEDVSEESLTKFAETFGHLIGPKNAEQAQQVAKILSISASQHPSMALALCQQIEVLAVFDESMDEDTINHLLDAATNADIARCLGIESFFDVLRDIRERPSADKPTQVAARRLESRIRGWEAFEDALSNTQGDILESSRMLKDIGNEEQSIGIWLESMTLHDDLLTKLSENPVLPMSQSSPPCLLRDSVGKVSHNEFITFVRGYIGVASVLAVLSWADSLGLGHCLEQTLAILHLWQSVEGYCEIVNHLLLLRQFTRRLEWITVDNDPPRKSGHLGEQILCDLASDPRALLRDDLVQTILKLQPPLSYIAENERLSMRKAALVAEDGLPAAIEELTFSSDHPLSLRRLRTLRVSLAVVDKELDGDKGEWRILQTTWDEHSIALLPQLVEIFIGVSDDINGHFLVTPPPRKNQALVDQLFRIADDLLHLISRLVPHFPLTTRSLRSLTVAIADVFVCTDAADMLYTQPSRVNASAQGTRQTCLDLLRSLSGAEVYVEPGKLGAEIILSALLDHGVHFGGSSRDPASHVLQMVLVIDHVLPSPDAEDDSQQLSWVTSVLPNVLPEFKSFFRLLDTENKVHVIKRLVKLDDGLIGIAEWLLVEELKELSQTLTSLAEIGLSIDRRLVGLHHVTLVLRLIVDLLKPSSNVSSWGIKSLASIPDAALYLTKCILAVLDGHYRSPHLIELASILGPHSSAFEDTNLAFAVILSVLRAAQLEPIPSLSSASTVDMLKVLPQASLNPLLLRQEIGRLFAHFADIETVLEEDSSTVILLILGWLLQQEDTRYTTLSGVTQDALNFLYDRIPIPSSAEDYDIIENARSKIRVDEDDTESFSPSPIDLPETLQLSLDSLKNLLNPTPLDPPSTPKNSKTPDILGMVVSPPTALLRSPAATGLTKTYARNDFRELRQVPSARQNTSRLPSMHVDVGIPGRLT